MPSRFLYIHKTRSHSLDNTNMLLTTTFLAILVIFGIFGRRAILQTVSWLKNLTTRRHLYTVQVDHVPTSAKYEELSGEEFIALCRLNSASFSRKQVHGIRWANQKSVIKKQFGSLVIQFLDKSSKDKILSKGLRLTQDGRSLHAAEFVFHLKQCLRCTAFGHSQADCPAKSPSCGNCGGSHWTKDHVCCTGTVPCTESLQCRHVALTCALCRGSHAAFDKDADCPVRLREIEMRERNLMNM